MDRHALSLQSAQLTRPRNYVESEDHAVRHPQNAPEWAFNIQDIPPETDFSVLNTPIGSNIIEEGFGEDEYELGGEGDGAGEGERDE